jgi:hypothetical protein
MPHFIKQENIQKRGVLHQVIAARHRLERDLNDLSKQR